MGQKKSRYFRTSWTDAELLELLNVYKNNGNKLKSLFSDKTFDTKYAWKNDLIRKMDNESINKLYYLIYVDTETLPYCKLCNSMMSYKEFSYSKRWKSFVGFRSVCNDCFVNRKHLHTTEIIDKRANTQRLFYKTIEGEAYKKILGERNKNSMLAYNKTQAGKDAIKRKSIEQSIRMKENILNGTFTPNITNSRTHWNAVIELEDGTLKKFRSSWEATFWNSNKHLLYEKIRIPYITESGINRVYIVDFYDEYTNTIYEIKPLSVWNKEKVKMDQVIKYCELNNITFKWINDLDLLDHVDVKDFKNPINYLQYKKCYDGITQIKDNKNIPTNI